MATRYVQRRDREWVHMGRARKHLVQCCDCGLVHLFQFKVSGSKLSWAATRLKRNTAAVRRHKRAKK
jgi:hypothetical protein